METYDVVVVGIGAMGSAAAYQLANDGAKVLGIDRFSPPHDLGSSHGDTRITRQAIGEGSEYVPLVMRSHELWREIEQKVGYELLTQCGGVIMGVPRREGVNDFVAGTTQAAKQYGVPHETLDHQQLSSRFPLFTTTDREAGYYEPGAGYVRPEACITAQQDLAVRQGATLHTNERVVGFTDDAKGVTVTTESSSYLASKMVLTAGAWVNELAPGYEAALKVCRQVLYWYDLGDKQRYEEYANLPVFLWEFGEQEDEFLYGFPATDGPDGGLKIATGNYTLGTTPDTVNREVSAAEVAQMYDNYIDGRIKGLSRQAVRATTCLYTVATDHKFVIDFHPEHDNVIVASPCSGHGFKHSAAIGEVLSQLATTGQSDIDISAFKLGRFQKD